MPSPLHRQFDPRASWLEHVARSITAYSREIRRRIRHALRNEPWLYTAIGLLWTTGPVTLLGLWAGYYLAYRHQPDPRLFLYFGVYILTTGILALVARLVRYSTTDVEKKAQRVQ
jgi:hypothetical protein